MIQTDVDTLRSSRTDCVNISNAIVMIKIIISKQSEISEVIL